MTESDTDQRIKDDKKLAKALLSLRNDPNWETVSEGFAEEMVKADMASRGLEGPAMYRSQGRASTFEWILKTAGLAEKTMANAMECHSRRVRQRR